MSEGQFGKENPQPSVSIEVSSDFSCSKCDYKTRIPFNLRRHIKLIHKIVGENIFKCDSCNDSYNTLKKLNDHVAAYCPQSSKMEFSNTKTKSVNNKALLEHNIIWSNRERMGSDKIENQHASKVVCDENTAKIENTNQFGCQKKTEFPKPFINSENVLCTPTDTQQDPIAERNIITQSEISVPESQFNRTAKNISSEKQLKSSLGSENKTRRQLASKRKQTTRARTAIQKIFEDKSANHLQLELTSKTAPFKCNLCPSEFSVQYNLNRHIKLTHERHKAFKCNLCPSEFSVQYNLNRHIKLTHERHKAFKCNLCPLKFLQQAYLTKHIKRIHERHQQSFKCSLCEKHFAYSVNLNSHILQCHTSVRRFQCKQCGFGFNRRDRHLKHTKMCQQNKKLNSIDDCPKFQSIDRNHSKEKKKNETSKKEEMQCPICGKAFQQISDLINHIRSHTKTDEKYDKEVEKPGRTFGIKTIQNDTLNEKQSKIEREPEVSLKGIENEPEGESRASRNKEKKFKMKKEHSSKNKPKLKIRPQRKTHFVKRNQSEYFSCSKCDYKTRIPFNLHRHINKHKIVDEDIFKCDSCNNSFSSLEELNDHISAYCTQNSKMEILNTKTKSAIKTFSEKNNILVSNSEGIGSDKIKDQHVFKAASDENTAAENTKQFSCQKKEIEFSKPLIGGENVLYTPAAAAEKIIIETEMCAPESQLNCTIAKETSSEKQLKLQTFGENRKMLSSKGKQKTWARNAKQFKEENLKKYTNSQLVNKSALYKCKMCPSKFFNRVNLNKHIRNAHERHLLFKCILCASIFARQCDLNRHIKLKHERHKMFICNLCEKHFRNSAELDSHMKAHSKTDCRKTFGGKENEITVHTFISKPLKNTSNAIGDEESIPVTVDSFKTEDNGRTRNLPPSGNPKKKLKKKQTNFNLSTKKLKLRPQRRGNLYDYDNQNTKLVKCDLCQKLFSTKNSLRYHFQHVHENPYSFKCKICQQRFSYKCNLKLHIAKVHANSKDNSDFQNQMNEFDLNDLTPELKNLMDKKVDYISSNGKTMQKCVENDETVHLVQFGKARQLLTSMNIPNETRTALAKALGMIYRGNLEEDLSKYKCKLCSITCLDYNALDYHMKRHNV